MTETKAMMERSIFLYELVKSMMGMSNSICKAMAPPNISASEVEMEASTAVPNMGRDTQEGVYLVAASDKHKPVTMPRCATLCCNTISMIVDKVTTHSNE